MKTITLSTSVVWRGIAPERRLHYGEKILSLGSCFSERIGSWLFRHGFDAMVNPFGTLYNPISIAQALEYLAEGACSFDPSTLLFEHQGKYHSFMHHSRYSRPTWEETWQGIEEDLQRGKQQLREGRWLLLTLGSAFLYTHKELGCVVANCHKLPEQHFTHTKGTKELFIAHLAPIIEQLLAHNEALEIILTVSPIRYLRYGAPESQRSKAELLLTAEALEERFKGRVHYFPAYEIMMDELRDYRYYAEDMIHPTDLAVEIIRQRLLTGWLSPSEEEALRTAEKLAQRALHRPMNATAEEQEAHRRFLEQEGERIRHKFPNLVSRNLLSPLEC